ncbi:hypothetical protein [Mycobacteroides abscessus]|nr:hypothetical protein [Mycobacteroides abscessus]SHW53835.1 Uncharacterised protein [Mycobacteroides abscessus subsp. abscessus]SIA40518.1 Uncharacterised protein [Mycobacteroides abscessus subsp. abscessus]SKR77212.1 Uncharacterised protein [Mycobacteroides abscessus subsp. abscessus]
MTILGLFGALGLLCVGVLVVSVLGYFVMGIAVKIIDWLDDRLNLL